MLSAPLLHTSPNCIQEGGIHPGCLLQVSPHEFMQAVMAASNKRFTIEKQSDALEFWSWFINQLHTDLTGGRRKRPSIISRCFQVNPMPQPNMGGAVIRQLPLHSAGAMQASTALLHLKPLPGDASRA